MAVKVTKPQIDLRGLANQTGNLDQYIGTAEVSSQKVSVQDELNIPAGDIASRPTNIPAGSTRWNTQTKELEIYDGSVWVAITTDYTASASTTLG